jgi:predicted RNA-binding protein with RPS1 domain
MEQLRDFVATFGHRLGNRRPGRPPKDLQRLLAAAAARRRRAHLDRRAPLHEAGALLGAEPRSLRPRDGTTRTSHRRSAAIPTWWSTASLRASSSTAPPWLDEEQLADVARTSSERERVAVAAERDSKDLKKVEFMQRHLGDEFEGTISGVTAFGFFVLLDDFFVDGLVHVSSLDDDYYLFVEEQHALVGERTRRRFRTGDRVRVRVAKVDIEERKIDFQLVDTLSGKRSSRRRTRR